MTLRRPTAPRPVSVLQRSLVTLLVVTTLAGAGVATTGPAGAQESPPGRQADPGHPSLDSRRGGPPTLPTPEAARAQAELARSLGTHGVVRPDPVTGTPRIVARLDGFLTPGSNQGAEQIVLDYVREHLDAFGLDQGDLGGFKLVKEYIDIEGTHHLSWAQTFRSIPAFDNELRASVSSDGRLINVRGAPHPNLAVRSTSPELNRGQAIARARRDAGGRDGDPRADESGELVLFGEAKGARLAWLVRADVSHDERYLAVIDASSGDTLWRDNLVSHATGKAWDYYPGAVSGGAQTTRDFTPWLTSATRLYGDNAHVFKDVNDDNDLHAGDDVAPVSGNWNFTFTPTAGSGCSTAFPCSWNSTVANSWQTNISQNATQVFYLVNRFHDHLLAAPIGFNEAAGNFEWTNSSGEGLGGDHVVAHVDDGANTGGGFPDYDHINNANMFTPPDGYTPRMQMYLMNGIGGSDSNAGDDASIVYHEYTHGLSNRLVTLSNGSSGLSGWQAGAMGEGWSDWYALDFLEDEGFITDTAAHGDVVTGAYVTGGSGIRHQPIDCPVASDPSEFSAVCSGGNTPHYGGFTYGDYGAVYGEPQVHADGEIWAETLWDLRAALGSTVSRSLITRAMELSPPGPSFLDMRNAILQADTVVFGGSNEATLWSVFATRGMGFFSDAVDGNDVSPIEDFSLPPSCPCPGSIRGTVTDVTSGEPVAGATVAVSQHNLTLFDVTNADGVYAIRDVPAGTYPRVVSGKPGFEPASAASVVVGSGPTTVDSTLRRDWAALVGGATIQSFTGPDYSGFGCGPTGAFDLSRTIGWGSHGPNNPSSPGPHSIVVKLPEVVDVTQFAIDTGAVCGDPEDAAVANFTIATSPDNVTFTTAYTQTGALPPHVLHILTPTAGTSNVRYVRLTMQTTSGNTHWMDMSELEVFGLPNSWVPKALALDPAGNGVFELGETVAAVPTWRNPSGGSESATGTLSSFAGPAGPLYAITDSAASYTSVPGGQSRSCADGANCYAVSLTQPASRPVQHLDASFVETLSNGATKTWTVHVGGSFSDVPQSHTFYRFIETMLHSGVTVGCATPNAYCPTETVPRRQMAIFLARALAGGDPNVPASGDVQGTSYNCSGGGNSLFTDVAPTASFCRHIHYIADEGVTLGCTASTFCPDAIVTRGQMATFIARSIAGGDGGVPVAYGPDPGTGRSYSCDASAPSLQFSDVSASNIFCRHVHYLWAKGFADGTTATTLSPGNQVNRGQMAKFLVNGFGLDLYGP